MALKIFLTGVTGYIGGDIFYALEKAHPDYEYTLLVRNEERAGPVKARYPGARLVYGTLDDSAVIEKAAAEADIVIHTANSADDVPSAKAIANGLAAGHTADKPGYWLHICGTGMLQVRDKLEKRVGQPPLPDDKYDDITDLAKITSLPDEAIHRPVDKIVLAAAAATSPSTPTSSSSSVRTAIIGPPCIFGPGRGPANTRSMQVYDMVRFALRDGFAPVVGTGLAEWDHVHVHDLSDLVVRLVAVVARQDEAGLAADPEVFGERGYYFCEAGSHRWGDVARWVADELVKQGFMAEPKVEAVTVEDLTKDGKLVRSTYALNSKSFASRARKYLGWEPTRGGLKEGIPEAVSSEAERLGIKPQAA